MNSRRENYKRRSAGFGNPNDRRVIRAIREEERRQLGRSQNFARNRDLPTEAKEARGNPGTDLSLRLRRWKEARALKKKLEELKKKPIFKVGVVHHKFYSPIQDIYHRKKKLLQDQEAISFGRSQHHLVQKPRYQHRELVRGWPRG